MNKGCIKKSCMVKVKAQVTLNGHEDMEVLTNVFKKWFVPQVRESFLALNSLMFRKKQRK